MTISLLIKLFQARSYLASMPHHEKQPWHQIYKDADAVALDLLDRMLTFDPTIRITVDEALAHSFLQEYFDPTDEACNVMFFFSFPFS